MGFEVVSLLFEGKMAGHPPVAIGREGRVLGLADRTGIGAAGVKPTAGRQVHGAGNVAPENQSLPVTAARVGKRHGRDEKTGIGMAGAPENIIRMTQFNGLAQEHHADPVGDVAHHPEIVGDEQVGQLQAFLQILEQIEDLGLDGNIQGGDGLVANHEGGVRGQGPGDADALALPAAELVRVVPPGFPAQAHEVQEFRNAPIDHRPVAVAVGQEGFGENAAHAQPRIKGGVGILEDDLHLFAQLAQGTLIQGMDIASAKVHRAAAFLFQAQKQPPQGGLAAARFPHQGKDLLFGDGDADIVHGVDPLTAGKRPGLDRKNLLQPPGRDNRYGHATSPFPAYPQQLTQCPSPAA
ncbi:hypothetical protein DESC_690051 [Desulfosarcina cetonica]|nr:hypothetical protein DESC_690051 [Desulfosarcina cetonica]